MRLEEMYRDWLDDLGEVQVGNLSWPAADVLKEMDPIAYRCGFGDYLSSLGESPPPCEDCGEPMSADDIYDLGMDDRCVHPDGCPEEEDED